MATLALSSLKVSTLTSTLKRVPGPTARLEVADSIDHTQDIEVKTLLRLVWDSYNHFKTITIGFDLNPIPCNIFIIPNLVNHNSKSGTLATWLRTDRYPSSCSSILQKPAAQ